LRKRCGRLGSTRRRVVRSSTSRCMRGSPSSVRKADLGSVSFTIIWMLTQSVTVRAPAKVNLHLGVGPLRADGKHELHTIYHAVSLFDTVVLERTDKRGVTVEIEGEDVEDVPDDYDTLAVRAVRAVAAASGVDPAAHLILRKDIPVGGGLAGGSSDAAAALVAADALWGANLSQRELERLAAGIGSD